MVGFLLHLILFIGLFCHAKLMSEEPTEAESVLPKSVQTQEEILAFVEVCTDGSTSSTCKQEHELTFGEKLLHNYFEYRKRNPQLFDNNPTTAQGIRIENPNPIPYDIYWYDPSRRQGIFKGTLRQLGIQATNSYVGHVFYFTEKGNKRKEKWRFTVEEKRSLYMIPPINEGVKQTERYLEIKRKEDFLKNYLKTTGRQWLAHYPRDPPTLHMWPADYPTQVHTVTSKHNYHYCKQGNVFDDTCEWAQKEGDIVINLEVMSTHPKVFAIENTLSDDEANLIVQLSKSRITRSKAGNDGGLVTETRTSENTWLRRSEHPVLETIYKRSANIFNISEEVMYDHKSAESLQVVHYGVGQEYKPHHDFGEDGRPQHRYITLLFYLNEQLNEHAGGETLFPHSNNGLGLALHAGKGNSIMFYNLLEDGNGDELTLHAGSPVKEGEKWLCNFWIWDPHR